MNSDSEFTDIYPPFEEWFASLDSEAQSKAERMIARLKDLGAENAEGWIRSELEEDIPQTARYVFLRRVWQEIRSWEIDGENLFESVRTKGRNNPDGYFAKAAAAIEKMLAAGMNLEDIICVARVGVYETMFDLIHVIDEGGDPDAGDDLPGWALIEISPEGEATGGVVGALHESILEVLPTEDERKYL